MTKLEYIWIDGTEDAPQLRSKTKVVEHHEWDGSVAQCPVWGFDGSSTNQAPGDNSDCVLKPVRIYENPLEENSQLVLCEVWNTDDTPHETNIRWKLHELLEDKNNEEPWFGFEQEYTLYKDGRPVGWPEDGSEPAPQGDYYCGRNKGENIARKHMDACIDAGIKISGINSEVMLGQWEYQVGADNPLRISDDVWVARWLMEKICAEYDIKVSLDPKPIDGDWNGAGCHTNFSTKTMRENGSEEYVMRLMEKFKENHMDHISVYGEGNERRLTGAHETSPITEFSFGVADRGCSIRIPRDFHDCNYKSGYIEDRRPASNMDPYLVTAKIAETCIDNM